MSSESLFTQCKGCNKSVSKSAKKCPECGKNVSNLSVIHWIGICFLTLIVIGIINSPDKKGTQPLAIEKITLEENMQLDYSWTKEGFGSVMEVDFIITNNNDVWPIIKLIIINTKVVHLLIIKIFSNTKDV